MDIFTCKLRLGGSVLNEVPKINVSAPEVLVLRAIHGHDAVVDMRRTGGKHANHNEERERLSQVYGADKVLELFGPSHRDLPTKVAGYEETSPLTAPTVENMDAGDNSAGSMLA